MLTFPRFFPCSLADNNLCGVDVLGRGYTTMGINALCEGLRESAITSLKCARPLHRPTKHCMLAPSNIALFLRTFPVALFLHHIL